jgi:hypothetical protein
MLVGAGLAVATPAAAQGVLYRYELHDASFYTPSLNKGAQAPFSVHRIGVIDESGVFFSGLMSAMSAQKVGEGVNEKGEDVDFYRIRAYPITPGARGTLEFAFEGPTDLDVDVDGVRSQRGTNFDYFELRVAIGGAGTFADDLAYASVDILDFVLRDVSGRSDGGNFGNDQYALYVGLEMGVLLPLSRVGGYARYDLVRGMFRLIDFGDDDLAAHTYDVGLVGSLGAGSLRLEARWGFYQWSDDDAITGLREVEGSMLTFGAQAAF